MPRNKKQRFVGHRPPASVFKPAGVPARELDWITLALDEYEAVRLADHLGMDQAAVAESLGVSRPTVSRILAEARRKIATAFVQGCALAIEGGPVQFVPGAGRRQRGRHGWRGGRGRG